MDSLQALVLGIAQGLTEFLPISSSAHLILIPWLLGWKDPGLTFDVALHLGTLVAVLGYFWRDWLDLLGGLVRNGQQAQRFLATLKLNSSGSWWSPPYPGPSSAPWRRARWRVGSGPRPSSPR